MTAGVWQPDALRLSCFHVPHPDFFRFTASPEGWVVHRTVAEISPGSRQFHRVRQFHLVRPQLLTARKIANVEPVKIIANRRYDFFVVEPDRMSAAAEASIVHLEAQSRNPVELRKLL